MFKLEGEIQRILTPNFSYVHVWFGSDPRHFLQLNLGSSTSGPQTIIGPGAAWDQARDGGNMNKLIRLSTQNLT